MKTDLFTYDELEENLNKFKANERFIASKNYFEKGIGEIVNPLGRAANLLWYAQRWYLMDFQLEKIMEATNLSIKVTNLRYEKVLNSDPRYLAQKSYDGLNYVEYLKTLSISYLLGYDVEDIKEYEKIVHIIKGRDILLDTLLNAMIGCEISADVMTTNVYPTLVEIIKEEDTEKAEDMMLEFMKKEWWKNTGKYGFRDDKNINTYVGAFAFETAAIAKIKGFDLSKFEGIKYFPIDMAYYREGKTAEVSKFISYDKCVKIGNKVFKFQSFDELDDSFKEGQLERQDFSNLVLENINFEGANLEIAKFHNCSIINCSFEGSNLFGVDIQDSKVINCNFKGIEAERVSFHKCDIINNNFSEGALFEGGMTLCDIEKNCFINSNLYHLDMTNSNVNNNDFTSSAFGDVKLEKTDKNLKVAGNNFTNADIQITEFSEEEKLNNTFKNNNK